VGRFRGDDGAAIVEFAIILPILVLLIFGIIEFSVAYNHTQALHAAAREGARFGSLPSSTVNDIKLRVADGFSGTTFDGTPAITVGLVDGGNMTTSTDRPCDKATPGWSGKVYVKVTVGENIAIPLIGAKTATLTGKGVFQCEPGPGT
jgi:Flp pilus assembly protein TadG